MDIKMNDLRTMAGFYDNKQDNVEAITAQDLNENKIPQHTWVFDHLNASIVGLDVKGLNEIQLKKLISDKLNEKFANEQSKNRGRACLNVYKDQIHWINESELERNKVRRWAPIPVVYMSVDELTNQIRRYYLETTNYGL